MRSEKNRKLLDEACRIAKAMDVQLVTRGMQPHSVVMLGGTPEQSVHDVRAELMAHDARWRLGDGYDDDDEELPCVEAAPGLERLAKRCVRAAAERQGVTVTPSVVGMLSKDVLKAAWRIDGVTDADGPLEMMSRGRKVFWEVVKAAAGDAWSIGESHMEEMDADFTCSGDTDVLPLRVLADAMQQKGAYEALYREHIAHGVLWIPQIRRKVAEFSGRELAPSEYVDRVKEALGLSGEAWEGIQRLAEVDARVLFRMISVLEVMDQAVMWSLAEAAHRAFANGCGWQVNGDVAEGLVEFLRALKENTPDGIENVLRERREDAGYWRDLGDAMLAAGEIVAAEKIADEAGYGAPAEKAWMLDDKNQQLMEWLTAEVLLNPGEVPRGCTEVVTGLSGTERVDGLVVWARETQKMWHSDEKHRLRRSDVEAAGEKVWSRHDEPAEARTDRVEVPRMAGGAGWKVWTVYEICTSTELKEEAKAMVHFVSSHEQEYVAGRLRIFSLRDSRGRRVSTIELKRKRSGGWALAEHRGVCDHEPRAEAKRAVEAWLGGMDHRVGRT